MRAFHDSWDGRYRAPLGAVAPGEQVEVSIDVQGCLGVPLLRTWVDGTGERRYPMHEVGVGEADGCVMETSGAYAGQGGVGEGGAGEDGWKRFAAQLQPDEVGVVWYQFVLTDEWGNEKRYGLEQGKAGGAGSVFDWEPPSFKLAVHGAEDPLGAGRALVCKLVGFMRQEVNAYELAEAFELAREDCSARAFAQVMAELQNVDAPSMFAQLAGLSDSAAGEAVDAPALDESQIGQAKGRLWCARLVQRLVSGLVSCDGPKDAEPETDDADSQGCWDADCDAIVENVEDLRRILPLFEGSEFRLVAFNEDVLGLWRGMAGEEAQRQGAATACLLINRSLQHAHTVEVPCRSEAVSEVIGGWGVPVSGEGEGRCARVHLYQLGSALLLFHGEQRLESALLPGMGVLAHITSLPAASGMNEAGSFGQEGCPSSEQSYASVVAAGHADVLGIPKERPSTQGISAQRAGTLGAPARAFVDWLAQAKVRYWQVLPANPTDEHGSPYAGISAFAGNARLLQPDWREGAQLAGDACGFDPGAANAANAAEDAAHIADLFPDEYEQFCEREALWLEPYAAFMAIRETVGEGVVWQDWPKRYRSYKPGMVERDAKLAAAAQRCRREQFAFQKQWADLRAHANERGIKIIGDMPIYVSSDSADVWANPGIFQLGPDGKPAVVAGCPPDSFAKDGQVWGNPVYDWDALKASGYGWWLARLKRAFDLYDYVRLDHFIGFARYFRIPAGQKASAGEYRPGPGMDFFRAAYETFGPLPVVAEDLGSITPAVRALVAACGFPGMDIIQFVDGGDPLAGYRPRPEKIAYTGTHDNQTLIGFVRERYPETDPEATAAQLVRAVAHCDAQVRIFALQDLAGLGDEARTNVPGTCEGNWAWQATYQDIDAASACLRDLSM